MQERALMAEGVIKLTCGDYEFIAKVHVCHFIIHVLHAFCQYMERRRYSYILVPHAEVNLRGHTVKPPNKGHFGNNI